MREPYTINTPHVGDRRARLAVDRARARATLDHDARRAHAIDDPRRDRGSAATRATTSKTTRRSLVIMNNSSGPKRVRATRRRATGDATGDARTRARGSRDRSIAGDAIDRDGRREKRANGATVEGGDRTMGNSAIGRARGLGAGGLGETREGAGRSRRARWGREQGAPGSRGETGGERDD